MVSSFQPFPGKEIQDAFRDVAWQSATDLYYCLRRNDVGGAGNLVSKSGSATMGTGPSEIVRMCKSSKQGQHLMVQPLEMFDIGRHQT